MVGTVHVAHDITDRKMAQDALQRAHNDLELRVQERTAELSQAYEALQHEMDERAQVEEKLRQAYKMQAIGTLAGGIAHDFNNILAAIIGFSEMVEEDIPEGSPIQSYIQRILSASFRGRDLVKQILTFSRKAELPRQPVSVLPIIQETIQLLRASLPTTIEIKLITKAITDTIQAAPAEVQQILMNLATNAAMAMREHGGILHISLSDIDFEPDSPVEDPGVEPGEYLQIVVEDSGSGMSPDIMKRVFEPFFTTRLVGEGTGMGLAVVYGIVKSLHGTITVESEPGVGSTFRVFLPKVRTETESEPAQPDQNPRGTERVLFVDDEELLMEWGKVALERLGYTVTALTDSAEALKLFSSDPSQFDLIITDQTMPGIPGLQLSKELLKIRPDIPIILCTGHSDTVSPEMAKEAGIREFLMKPLAKQELAQVIRRVLDAKV
jgi:signal transduction histidine kinase/ActR/RegA family two-component response regulator